MKIPAALGSGYSLSWEPTVDGEFLPTDPVTEESFAEAGKDIPLLIGSNLNELGNDRTDYEPRTSPVR